MKGKSRMEFSIEDMLNVLADMNAFDDINDELTEIIDAACELSEDELDNVAAARHINIPSFDSLKDERWKH